jgi:carboxymethylenebutenolidase
MTMATRTAPLTARDLHGFEAFIAEPDGKPRGALVVVQEIFGVNAHIRGVAEGYARDGYLAIAPALFDRVERHVDLGYDGADVQRGFALKAAVNSDDALLDLAAAVAHVAAAGKVGIVGFCWGGLLAWLAACKLDGLSASVPYYGSGIPQQAALSPRCPVLAHFGEQDTHITLHSVRQFAAARPEVQLHLYPAGHGFNCERRGSYHAESAALARDRTLAFLRQHVG